MAISRGFRGRRRDDVDPARVPPGQYVTGDFPVLSAGPTPHTPLADWDFTIRGLVDEPVSLDLGRVPGAAERDGNGRTSTASPSGRSSTPSGTGVSLDTLLDGVETSAEYVLAFCDGGYTTNLPLEDLTGGKAWIAYEYDGEPLEPEHGGPARLLVPHLYFWKSAKWVRGLELRDDDEPGFWEGYGYHNYGDPWQEQRYCGRLSWQLGERWSSSSRRRRGPRASCSTCPSWSGHRAGQHVDVRLTAEDGYQAQRSYSIASAPEDERLVADGRAARRRRGLAVPRRRAPTRRRARAARPDRRLLRLGGALGGPLLLRRAAARGSCRYARSCAIAAIASTVPVRLLYSAADSTR